ncbi:MAG: LemA family protein [Bacilli bacterium]|nr:LemA family protein [Bacilli bacterium]
MDKIIIVILALIACFTLLAAIYIYFYNRLQKFLIRIKESEIEVTDSLKKRYELLVKMEQEINTITGLKQDNFKDFKSEEMSNFDVDRKLFKIMSTFEKIKEDYSDKLDVEAFRNLEIEIKIVDEKIVAVKAYYNKYTTSLNMLIKRFPSNIIARIHRIEEGEYFNNKNMNYQEIMSFKF